MDITVNVAEVTLDTIVREATEYGDGATIGDLVASQITQRLVSNKDWYDRVREVAEIKREVIRETVRPIIEEAVTAPIQKTSGYGDPIGEPVSLREVIVDEARKLLNKAADQYNRSGQTVLQKIVAEEVQSAMRAEIAAEVAKAKAAVADEIGKQIAAAVTVAVRGK